MGKVLSLEKRLAEQEKFAETILTDPLTESLVGANELRKDPSTYGKPVGADDYYNSVMASEPMAKVRNEIYNDRLEEARQLGIAESPTVSNYDVVVNKFKQYIEAVRLLSLGKLESIAKKLATGLKFNLPEKLKKIIPYMLMQKAQSKEELGDEEKNALSAFQIFQQAYLRGAAEKARGSALYEDLNRAAAQVEFKYLSKKEQEKYLKANAPQATDGYEMQEAVNE